jgi:hypothetical protein
LSGKSGRIEDRFEHSLVTAASVSPPAVSAEPRAIAAQLSGLSAVLIFALGACVLLGWSFDIEGMKGLLPGVIVMIPNTAVGFIAAGAALWLRRWSDGPRALLATALSVFVMVVGLVTCVERITGWNAGIDLLLFADDVRRYPYQPPGRMATNSTLAFSLAGFALFTMDSRTVMMRWASQVSAMIGVSIHAERTATSMARVRCTRSIRRRAWRCSPPLGSRRCTRGSCWLVRDAERLP